MHSFKGDLKLFDLYPYLFLYNFSICPSVFCSLFCFVSCVFAEAIWLYSLNPLNLFVNSHVIYVLSVLLTTTELCAVISVIIGSTLNIKCNGISPTMYNYLKDSPDLWFCVKCIGHVFPHDLDLFTSNTSLDLAEGSSSCPPSTARVVNS